MKFIDYSKRMQDDSIDVAQPDYELAGLPW